MLPGFVFFPIPKVICTNLKKGLLRRVGVEEAHGHHSFKQCPVHGEVHTCAQRELGNVGARTLLRR